MTIFLEIAKDFILKEVIQYRDAAIKANKNKFKILLGRNILLTDQKVELAKKLIEDVNKFEDKNDDELNFTGLKSLLDTCHADSSKVCGQAQKPTHQFEPVLMTANEVIKGFHELLKVKGLTNIKPEMDDVLDKNNVNKEASPTLRYKYAYDVFQYYAAHYYIEKSEKLRNQGLIASGWSLFTGGPDDNSQDLDITLAQLRNKFEGSNFDEKSKRATLEFAIQRLLEKPDLELKEAMGKALREITLLPFPQIVVPSNNNNSPEQVVPGVISPSQNNNNNNNQRKSQDKISVGIENTLLGGKRNSKSEQEDLVDEEENDKIVALN